MRVARCYERCDIASVAGVSYERDLGLQTGLLCKAGLCTASHQGGAYVSLWDWCLLHTLRGYCSGGCVTGVKDLRERC